MRRAQQCLEWAQLPIFERIMGLYAPYVLVRCARYTNRRRQAQQIGAYTLISTCILADKLGPVLPLGRIVDTVVGVAGPDVVSQGQGRAWSGRSEELLIVDRQMRKMAQALNSLKGPLREVLVLHHASALDADDLARLLQEPAGEVVTKIRRAERLLAARLGAPDALCLLAQFVAGLDTGWMDDVVYAAMDYLTACAARTRPRHRCRD